MLQSPSNIASNLKLKTAEMAPRLHKDLFSHEGRGTWRLDTLGASMQRESFKVKGVGGGGGS